MRNSFRDELHLQDTIERILKETGTQYFREHSLSKRDRIDFRIGDTGMECKIRPGGMAVWRQLQRYTEHLTDLILVTTAPLDRRLQLYRPDGTPQQLTIIELWKNLP